MEFLTAYTFEILFYWAPCVFVNLFVLRFLYRKIYTKDGLYVPAGIITLFLYATLSLIPIFNVYLMFNIEDGFTPETPKED